MVTPLNTYMRLAYFSDLTSVSIASQEGDEQPFTILALLHSHRQ